LAEKPVGRAAQAMKRILILCEGQTEQEFVNVILAPFLTLKGVWVIPFLANTSTTGSGGALNYERYKRNIELKLKEEPNAYVTSLIDFFRLSTDFPDYSAAKKLPTKVQQVEKLEATLNTAIPASHFLPYIQLHEFEALLFSDVSKFEDLYDLSNRDKASFQKITTDYPNPEDINEGPNTAPSKRILSVIPNYEKVLEGIMLAEDIGIEKMRARCPRFKAWLDKLIALGANA
jgi:hypothetical protein